MTATVTSPPRSRDAAPHPSGARPPQVVPARPPVMSAARAMTWVVSVISAFTLFFVVFLLVLSPLQQSRAQDVLYTTFRSQLAAATAPFGVDPIAPGSPIAVMEVPVLGLRQVVVEGTAGADLRDGPGHLRVTTLPGQLGTSVIFGRSTTYGGPFHDLPGLQPGDRLQLTTGQGVFAYKVEDVRRDGDPQPPALTADQGRLLFVTTESGTLGAQSTVYVDALLTSPPAVTPPRSTVIAPTYEDQMASDPSALLPLSLWLFGLLCVGAFAAWGVARWGRAQTWIVAVPLLLATLWGASDSAAMLLPNLM